jgi:hypothetical protein
LRPDVGLGVSHRRGDGGIHVKRDTIWYQPFGAMA